MHYQCLPDWKSMPELSGLRALPNPPKQLFYNGQWNPELFSDCVAVIGSRRMTQYARSVIDMLIPQLVFAKKTVVSGFMYGVDQYAHQVCIQNGGKTIAVLGWGITRELFDYEKKLAEDIVSSGGLLLSEWENQASTLWTFPVRNRIVAALCSDVIVVEATLKSGSLITANIAQKLKRTLWAVPGPITSKLSEGTNTLIDQGKAKMWMGQQKAEVISDDPLIRMLQNESLSVNDIARKTGTSTSDVGAQLSLLEISGAITQKEGKYYVCQN